MTINSWSCCLLTPTEDAGLCCHTGYVAVEMAAARPVLYQLNYGPRYMLGRYGWWEKKEIHRARLAGSCLPSQHWGH